jgi:hypothetical protein
LLCFILPDYAAPLQYSVTDVMLMPHIYEAADISRMTGIVAGCKEEKKETFLSAIRRSSSSARAALSLSKGKAAPCRLFQDAHQEGAVIV